MEAVVVDGSEGEGGGQILRTAVAFAAIKGVPVRIMRIRAGRDVPGLRRQHVSAVRVLASVFGGTLRGDTEGSTEITFVPAKPRNLAFSTDMGTAASITLVLQAVVPAVALAGSELNLSLTGGTDVPWSPTFDYFSTVVLAAYRAMGIHASASSSRRGYYPKGGGRVAAEMHRSPSVVPLDLTSPPGPAAAYVVSRCGSLPKMVAERQAHSAVGILAEAGVRVEGTEVTAEESSSPGTSVLVYSVGKGRIIGADAIGARGKPAEAVGAEAAARFASLASSGACVDANLADMVLPLLSMATGPSRLRVPEVTPHLKSGMRLAEEFTSCGWSAEKQGETTVVSVTPAGP